VLFFCSRVGALTSDVANVCRWHRSLLAFAPAPQMSGNDRYTMASQVAHLQAKYTGTGQSDTTKG
jgi:hypothetical protein